MSYFLPVPKKMVDIRPAPFHKTDIHMKHCIDFALPVSTPIRAAAEGVVISRESRFNKSYSDTGLSHRTNYVEVQHTNGQVSLYVHLKWRSVRIRVGQKVRRGQIIALSGDTGYATYPHLHFGLYDNGNNIPVKFTG